MSETATPFRLTADPFNKGRVYGISEDMKGFARDEDPKPRSNFLARLSTGSSFVVDDHEANFSTDYNPWDSNGGFDSMDIVRVEGVAVPDIDRVRREYPPVDVPVKLTPYDYASDVSVIIDEPESPAIHARASASRTGGAALKRVGLVSALHMKEVQLAGALVKLGSALDHLINRGTIIGPMNRPTVLSTGMETFSAGRVSNWGYPIVVSESISDACLSAFGYLMLCDNYRYMVGDGRVAVRDAMTYPGGTCKLLFIFSSDARVRQVDVGGGALTATGFMQLYELIFDGGLRMTANVGVYSGALLNLAYGTPMLLEPADKSRIVVVEARDDFVVNGQRDGYRTGPGAPPVLGSYRSGLNLNRCSKLVDVVLNRIRREVKQVAPGQFPAGNWRADGAVPQDGIGDFVRFDAATGVFGNEGWDFVFTNWMGRLIVGLTPHPGVSEYDWALCRGRLNVFTDMASEAQVLPAQARPDTNNHVPCRLMHSQASTAGYLVPKFEEADLAMIFSNHWQGHENGGSQHWPRLRLSTLLGARWDSKNRLLFRTEHSLFHLYAADYGLTPGHLMMQGNRFVGDYTRLRASGTNTLVLPPLTAEGWSHAGNFQHFELAAYRPIREGDPYRSTGSYGENRGYRPTQGDMTFTDDVEGRRLMDAVVKRVYYDGGHLELAGIAALQYTIVRYANLPANQPLFTGCNAFPKFMRSGGGLRSLGTTVLVRAD